jgi:hypothetical protein
MIKMKTIYLVLFIVLNASAFSQTASQYDNILLTTANEYRRAEPQVMLAADYVYSSPIDKDDKHRTDAIRFIMKWMQGTSDYSFPIDETFTKITKNDNELFGVYMACLSKYALSKGKGVSREDVKYNSFVLLADYCQNPNSNYKVKGEVKKMVDAKNLGTLKEYLSTKK